MKLKTLVQRKISFTVSRIPALAFVVTGLLWGNSQGFAQGLSGACGSLANAYGPYDARKDPDKLPIVLGAHFTPEVENLIKGNSSYLGGDIDYTLRAIPNYHRALMAMAKLAAREKKDQPANMRYTVDCWFQRATAFAPDDAIVRMLYSTYLNGKGRGQEANSQLEIAAASAKDNGFTHYNIGLHYFDLKNYDKALAQAHKAIELGFTQVELKGELVRVGKWVEPADPSAAPAAAANPAASAPAAAAAK